MAKSRLRRYDGAAISLHWLSALVIIGLLACGLVMTGLPRGSSLQFSLFQWHKSFGVVALALALVRAGWRLAHGAPELPASMAGLERLAAHLGHIALYLLIFVMPLSGWALVSVSPLNIPTMLFGVVHWPHIPFLASLADKKPYYDAFRLIHEWAAWALIVLLVGHAGAALRHHFFLKDDVLTRMLPRFGTSSRSVSQ